VHTEKFQTPIASLFFKKQVAPSNNLNCIKVDNLSEESVAELWCLTSYEEMKTMLSLSLPWYIVGWMAMCFCDSLYSVFSKARLDILFYERLSSGMGSWPNYVRDRYRGAKVQHLQSKHRDWLDALESRSGGKVLEARTRLVDMTTGRQNKRVLAM